MDWSKDIQNEKNGKIVLHLDRLMVERKISLNNLAEQVGITVANLSKIKNNHNFNCSLRGTRVSGRRFNGVPKRLTQDN